MFERTTEKTPKSTKSEEGISRFTTVTFTVFLIVGVPLLYAIWFRLFWLNFMWGVDFGLAMLAGAIWAMEDSLRHPLNQEED